MQPVDAFEVHLQRLVEPGSRDGAAASFRPFPSRTAISPRAKSTSLTRSRQALEQTQPGAVHEPGHHPRRPAQAAQDSPRTVPSGVRTRGNTDRTLSRGRTLLETGNLAFPQDLAVQEEKRAEGLVLGGRGDVPLRREAREVARHLD